MTPVRGRSHDDAGGLATHDAVDVLSHDEDPTSKRPPVESSQVRTLRASTLDTAGIVALPRPAPLIDGVLDRTGTAIVYGPSGAGKTFVTISFALSCATGTPWFGHDVHDGPVTYVVGEGLHGLGARVRASQEYWRHTPVHPIHWITRPVNLLDDRWVAALATLAEEQQAVLTVLETLSRCMPGGNENGPEDMTKVVESMDRIQRASGGLVVAVHHSGKDLAAGSRGHSALRAAMDTELRVEGSAGRITVWSEKQRNSSDGHAIERLRLVEFGESCVLDERHDELGADDREMNANDRRSFDALAEIELPGGIANTEWKTAAIEAGVTERTFARARKRLVASGEVVNVGTTSRPRYVTCASASASASAGATECQ